MAVGRKEGPADCTVENGGKWRLSGGEGSHALRQKDGSTPHRHREGKSCVRGVAVATSFGR